MPRFSPRLAFLLLPVFLLCLGVGSASATPLSGVQVTRILPEYGQDFYERQLDGAKGTRVAFVRTEIRWDQLEPDAGGRRDADFLASMDLFFKLAAQRHLKVVATMLGTPCWASFAPSDDRGDCSGADKNSAKVTAYPPRNASDYAAAAGFVAGRYKSQLHGFEVWNEPDQQNELYFAGPDKPRRYAAILRASYKAVKGASPKTLVLGGSLVGANGRFLRALYKAGIKGSYDALSVHYYDLVLASIRSIRQVQRENRDRKPLWLGEFGWTDCYPQQQRQGGHTCVSSRVQAASIRDIFRAIRRTSYIKGAVVYNLDDNSQYDFGLIDESGKLKSAYASLRKVARRAPAPRRPSLKLKRSGPKVIASGSGPAGDAYELDVYKRGSLRYKLTFRLDRNLRYRFTLPRVLGSRGLTVKVYQYWLGAKKGKTRRL